MLPTMIIVVMDVRKLTSMGMMSSLDWTKAARLVSLYVRLEVGGRLGSSPGLVVRTHMRIWI